MSFLAELLMPLGALWFGLLVAGAWQAYRRRWHVVGTCGGLAFALWLIGGTPLSDDLLTSLEMPYARFEADKLEHADAVVLLGGSSVPSRREAAGMHLNRKANRTLMALYLMREGKADTLVIGGGKKRHRGKVLPLSENARDWFQHGNFFTNEIVALPVCGNTRDEAIATKALVKEREWERVLLITSASHMTRAAAVFRSQGVEVTEAPCAFQTGVSLMGMQRWFIIPRTAKFVAWDDYLHEVIGWYYYRLRGWITAEAAQQAPELRE